MESETNNIEAHLATANAELSVTRLQLLQQLLEQDPNVLTDAEKRDLILALAASSKPKASAPSKDLVVAEGSGSGFSGPAPARRGELHPLPRGAAATAQRRALPARDGASARPAREGPARRGGGMSAHPYRQPAPAPREALSEVVQLVRRLAATHPPRELERDAYRWAPTPRSAPRRPTRRTTREILLRCERLLERLAA